MALAKQKYTPAPQPRPVFMTHQFDQYGNHRLRWNGLMIDGTELIGNWAGYQQPCFLLTPGGSIYMAFTDFYNGITEEVNLTIHDTAIRVNAEQWATRKEEIIR